MPIQDAAPSSSSLLPELTQACAALWMSTLSLMTAFMQDTAPQQRFLLARRIAANLTTLSGQECFAADCRDRFKRLARRWDARACALGTVLGCAAAAAPLQVRLV
jgi:hypothetical protein